METRKAKKVSRSVTDAESISIFAIITARGGSKRVPGKNIRLLNGKPLIAHTILAAKECALISRCFVSTDDEEIGRVSRKWGAEVIERPAHLAGDEALSKDVVRHALIHCRDELGLLPDYFVLLQPTSPLRTAVHLKACIEMFLNSGMNSALSVTEAEHHPYIMFKYDEKAGLESLFEESFRDYPRQKFPRVYRPNGAIYLLSSELFLEKDSFYVKPIFPFMMSPEESVDIDTELDLQLASLLLSLKI